MIAKHTQGPWELRCSSDPQDKDPLIWKSEGVRSCWLATIHRPHTESQNSQQGAIEDKANADLMVAAPKLLEQLQKMVGLAYRGSGGSNTPPEIKEARAVIAEALGEEVEDGD